MDQYLFLPGDASFGQFTSSSPINTQATAVLQPSPASENDLPWWHTIDDMIGNLPVDDSQRARLKVYAECVSNPEKSTLLPVDLAGIDPDVVRIVTTGARKIAKQQAMSQDMDKSMTAAQMMRDTVRKAGEGSRGGQVIGHTRSGKPIYHANHEMYETNESFGHATHGWSTRDHLDAIKAHQANRVAGTSHAAGKHAGVRADAAHEKRMANKRAENAVSKADADVGSCGGRVIGYTNFQGVHEDIAAKHASAAKTAAQMMRDTVRKAGEGSRGGQILGHTKSGKPIYSSGARSESYSKQDHKDAQSHHESAARESRWAKEKAEDKGNKLGAQTHADYEGTHKDIAAKHAAAAKG